MIANILGNIAANVICALPMWALAAWHIDRRHKQHIDHMHNQITQTLANLTEKSTQ